MDDVALPTRGGDEAGVGSIVEDPWEFFSKCIRDDLAARRVSVHHVREKSSAATRAEYGDEVDEQHVVRFGETCEDRLLGLDDRRHHLDGVRPCEEDRLGASIPAPSDDRPDLTGKLLVCQTGPLHRAECDGPVGVAA